MYDLKEDLIYLQSKHVVMYKLEPQRYPSHWHMEMELLLVTRGWVEYTVNLHKMVLETGDCILVNSGDLHSIDKSSQFSEAYILIINIESLNGQLDASQLFSVLFSQEAISKHEFADEYHMILSTVQQLHEEYNGQERFHEFSILNYIQQLLIRLFRCLPYAKPLNCSNNMLAQTETTRLIISYFKRTSLIDYSLRDLANALGYTPAYLCKLFRGIFNTTFQAHVTRLRIFQAQNLLENTSKRITQIGEAAGFPSDRAFHIAFKKLVGLSPADYRKRHRGEERSCAIS